MSWTNSTSSIGSCFVTLSRTSEITSSDAAIALALQLHRQCRRCSPRSPPRARAAGRCVATCFDFRRRRAGSARRRSARWFVSGERRSRRHDVVEDEAAFVHLRQQIGSEEPVAAVRAGDRRAGCRRRATSRPRRSPAAACARSRRISRGGTPASPCDFDCGVSEFRFVAALPMK